MKYTKEQKGKELYVAKGKVNYFGVSSRRR